MKFDTVREDIHARYPELAELVDRQFPDDRRGQKAFKYALYLYLRKLPHLGSVDGWKHLTVVDESPTKLRAVGIMWILPSSKLPIDAEFRIEDGAIAYRILVGVDDERWRESPESWRWNAVDLYATERAEPSWNWDLPLQGFLEV